MIKVVIEAEAGSCSKNAYDEKTLEYKGTGRVSRPYPYPYGFIMGTKTADGDGVDCYVITKSRVRAGTIVECEPVGLLEQEEDGEADHKVIAAMHGENVKPDQGLRELLRDFIYGIFTEFPEAHVTVGQILPRPAAQEYIRKFRDA